MSLPTADVATPTYVIDGVSLGQFIKNAGEAAEKVSQSNAIVKQFHDHGRPNSSAIADADATIRSAALWAGVPKEIEAEKPLAFPLFGERIRQAIKIFKS